MPTLCDDRSDCGSKRARRMHRCMLAACIALCTAIPGSGLAADGDVDAPRCSSVSQDLGGLPYSLVGVSEFARHWSALLDAASTRELVRAGDVLHQNWRIEGIDERGVVLSFLPSGQCMRLRFGAEAKVAVTPAGAPGTRADAAFADRPGAAQQPPPERFGGGHALTNASNTSAPGSTKQRAAPAVERRIASADIPREPWACEAALRNALGPCRNTWSMSDDERAVCRSSASQRYNRCLAMALATRTDSGN